MKRRFIMCVCSTVLASLSFSASATDFQVSAGPSLVTDGDVRIFAGTARGAVFFNDYFGIEAEGSIGFSESSPDLGGVDIPVELDSQLGAFAVGRYKVDERGEVFARIGYMKADFSFDISGLNLPPEAMIDPTVKFDNVAFGIGGTYFFNKNSGIRGDVTSITGDGNGIDGSIQTLTLSYVHRFGGK